MRYIDLHVHTNCSDGACSVDQILEAAQATGIFLLSISDHNTVDAYDMIPQYKHLFTGRILPAVELSTVFEGEFIELLGYGIDLSNMQKQIRKRYPSFYDKQVKEAELDTLGLLNKGVVLSDAFVQAMLHCPEQVFDPHWDTNRPYLLQEIKRHQENAVFFANQTEFETLDEQRFTREYLFHSESTLYIDQSMFVPDMVEVIDMIHQCNGLAFLAHPFIYSSSFIKNKLKKAALTGIDGIESHYGTFSAEQKQFLSDFCEQAGLYQSGGSDFHGLKLRPNNILGFSGNIQIPYSIVQPWLDQIQDRLL